MRSALRWTSLVGTAAILYGMGVARFHHSHFTLFLAVVVLLAMLTLGVFLATRDDRVA